LRGLTKVNIEFGLISIAHNFLKQVEKNHLFQEENPNLCKKPSDKFVFSVGFRHLKRLLRQPPFSPYHIFSDEYRCLTSVLFLNFCLRSDSRSVSPWIDTSFEEILLVNSNRLSMPHRLIK
jgi:hypothetical protein